MTDNSTIDHTATLSERDLEAMLEAISAAWSAAPTPSDLRERFAAFAVAEADQVRRLDAALLGSMAWWLVTGAEAGHDRDVLDQVCLQAALRAIAIIARAMKERQGKPFEPARVAIVAYEVAAVVAGAPDFKADLEGAAGMMADIDVFVVEPLPDDDVATVAADRAP